MFIVVIIGQSLWDQFLWKLIMQRRRRAQQARNVANLTLSSFPESSKFRTII